MSVLTALIDSDVSIDSMTDRKPFTEDALALLKQCENGAFKGYIAAHSIPNIFYILRKLYTEEERRQGLSQLCSMLSVANLRSDCIHNALTNTSFHDFEDCLQMECASEIGADYIITRNIKDYANSSIPAILPDEFLKLIDEKIMRG
jgi:predicted nucleic acid-binding protein